MHGEQFSELSHITPQLSIHNWEPANARPFKHHAIKRPRHGNNWKHVWSSIGTFKNANLKQGLWSSTMSAFQVTPIQIQVTPFLEFQCIIAHADSNHELNVNYCEYHTMIIHIIYAEIHIKCIFTWHWPSCEFLCVMPKSLRIGSQGS